MTLSLSPSRSRTWAISSAVAFSPATRLAASPGARSSRMNTQNPTMRSIGMATSTRRAMYLSTAGPLVGFGVSSDQAPDLVT